ncbi:TVP38/TMEM64 family protein [Paenibacillus ihuae]|uniref:TVP38/TMEM64 family protein n=1 Tax=Paenibacillus ihuae TaxID=1232431 RepID=UPI0006D5B0BD|nr:VTT domain-containing protein [Paenibacillus ihuae]
METLAIQSEVITQWLLEWGAWSIAVSLIINIVLSVIGFIPSVALTTVNIVVFGLVPGFLISLAGEISGAAVSYFLYRKGIWKLKGKIRSQPKVGWISRMKTFSPKRQFFTVLLARLTPFMPSSLVTLICVISEVRFASFIIASAIGKIPSLLLEALAGYGYAGLEDNSTRLFITFLFLFLLCVYVLFNRKKKN